MKETNDVLMGEDLDVIWHPCTQMKDHENLPLIPIASGNGVYLYDYDGNKYIDAISSWWVNIFGHCNPYINEQIKKQLDTLEHVILAGFTHKPAISLSKKLVSITPNGLDKVFFADNGSSAIEVALKMSYHAFKNKGIDKPLFLSLSNSYHGETMGALSVGDVDLYKNSYKPLLIKSIQVPVPLDESINAAKDALVVLGNVLEKRHKEIAAMIVEPLVQGAGGMHMYHPYYLQEARRLTKKYDIYFIADEIMTGFGRTGKMFACEYAEIVPDFITLSKGLTGGYLPLSVVLTTNDIYDIFYCDYSEQKAFLHSHSYTGNPLACAAAIATLDIFENENILIENNKKSAYMKKHLERFDKLVNVKETRILGMIAVIELTGYLPQERQGLKIYQYGLNNGVLLRPLGNVVYVMPPYTIENKEIDTIFDVAFEAISSLR